MSGQERLMAALEAVFFACPRPLELGELARVLETEAAEVQIAVDNLAADYLRRGAGVELRKLAGGYQLATRAAFADELGRLGGISRRAPLSRAALETLAVVAYKQPVTRAQIEQVRGVGCEGALATLLERGMIQEAGRKDAPGRPLLYATTREFLAAFGLQDLQDLPAPEEAEDLRQERLELG